MGMWYGIEIISHRRDVPDNDNYTADCPVIYFFEDNAMTTLSPLHANYNYGYNYGSGYDLNQQQRQEGKTRKVTFVDCYQVLNASLYVIGIHDILTLSYLGMCLKLPRLYPFI